MSKILYNFDKQNLSIMILKVKIPVHCVNKRITDKIEKAIAKAKEEEENVAIEIASNEYSVRDMVIYGNNVYDIILSPYTSDGVEFDNTLIILKGDQEEWISPEDVETLDKLISSTIEKFEKSKTK